MSEQKSAQLLYPAEAQFDLAEAVETERIAMLQTARNNTLIIFFISFSSSRETS
jgi:hypothetical protein